MTGVNVQRRRHEGGFTLIEVMLSLVLFAVGMLGITSMQVMGLRGAAYSDDYGRATRLAMELFETSNNYALTSANFSQGAFTLPDGAMDYWQTRVTDELGANAAAVVNLNFDAATQLNTLIVTVQWGGNHEVTLTSQLAGQT
jgi:type IV pilus assembly protein PilV